MNAKRKDTGNEHRSRQLLEAAGYAVTPPVRQTQPGPCDGMPQGPRW